MGGTYLCGVDIGTTSTKVSLIEAGGRVVAEAQEPSHLIQPAPGWVEQDPEEMAASAERTIARCLEQAGLPPGEVAAVAVIGQMAGIGAVDREWNAPIPYDSWLDTRCDPYVARMRQETDHILALSGGPPSYSHGPKILWWQHEHPDAFARVHKFVVPGAFVAGRLAGLKGDDAYMDSTYLHFSNLADLRAGQWSEALCEAFGVPIEKLPRIVEPWDVVGQVTPEAARRTGLLAGTPVVAGGGDQAAAMLGAGVVRPGMAYDAAGTASVFALCTDRYSPDVTHRTLLTARMVVPGLWYAIGYINGGGLNLRWFRDMVRRLAGPGQTWEYAHLDALAEAVAPGSDELVFVPHLGGRVCPNRPELRGAWIGLTWSHGAGHLWRALLEAVAYEYALYLAIERGLAPGAAFAQVRVVGGGSQSNLWNQIKADVLGLPYARLNRTEAGSLGAALLAGYGVGVFRDLETAAGRFVWPVQHYTPDPERTARYRSAVAFYRQLVEQHAPLWEGGAAWRAAASASAARGASRAGAAG